VRRHRLVAGVPRFGGPSGQKRGQKVGPNPTDRGKSGSKRHLLTDALGLPLNVVLTAANVHDSKVFEQLLDAVAPIKALGRGRPCKRPKKLQADKGYDFPHCRRALHKRGIRVRIARRGKDSSRRLGRHRWVIERTFAWLSSYRRLTIRYERRADLHEAFLHLACALVCFARWIRRGEVV
jgi:transposase